jgi:uncharacterized membrane protein SirB2
MKRSFFSQSPLPGVSKGKLSIKVDRYFKFSIRVFDKSKQTDFCFVWSSIWIVAKILFDIIYPSICLSSSMFSIETHQNREEEYIVNILMKVCLFYMPVISLRHFFLIQL